MIYDRKRVSEISHAGSYASKENSDKLDLLEFCKSKLKTRCPEGFDIEKANHRAEGDV